MKPLARAAAATGAATVIVLATPAWAINGAPASPDGGATSGGGLPVTGPAVGSILLVGAALIAAGVVLLSLRALRSGGEPEDGTQP